MDEAPEKTLGRNEPCPCGSGKKYKRCCGVSAAPKITPPKNPGLMGGMPGMPGMGNPDMEKMMGGMDQAWMLQFSQALQRLPKGQMQRLQAIMQKAMSGRDVTQEAAEFEKTLPVDLQQMMANFKMPEGMSAPEAAADLGAGGMTAEEAKAIVAAAAAQGEIPSDEAEKLLATPTPTAAEEAGNKFSKLFKFGKKF